MDVKTYTDQAVPSKLPFLGLNIDHLLWDAIEDYRFSRRFPNRTAAVEDLIRAGLAAKQQQVPEPQPKRGRPPSPPAEEEPHA